MHATATGSWATIETVETATAKHRRSSARLGEVASLLRELASTRRQSLRVVPSAPPPTGPRRTTGAARRVLLVEDDAHAARATARGLLRAGYDVQRAEDGAAACRMLATEEWDAAVVDLYLGAGCSGLAVAREARLRWPSVRIVLWTGQLAGADLDAALTDTGACAAVEKSQGVLALVAALELCVGGR